MPIRANFPFYEVQRLADPPAGSDVGVPVDGDHSVRVIAATFDFTTAVGGGQRVVSILFSDGTTTFYRAAGSFDQGPGLSYRYSLNCTGSDGGSPATVIHIPLPSDNFILLPGWRIQSAIVGIQPGDQVSNIGILTEVFPNGPSMEWFPTSPAMTHQQG